MTLASEVGSGALLVFTDGCVFIGVGGGRGEKWHLSTPLFLEKFPNNLCPSRTHSEINKCSLPSAPGIFQTAASSSISAGLFFVLSL